jgi:dienelactone hydrolase
MERYRCEEAAATLGWPCFALDVYGTGVRPATDAEAEGNMTALTEDPTELHARLAGSLAALLAPGLGLFPAPINASAVVANGYCFGGQMALELARGCCGGGQVVAAVTSFHGELDSLTPAAEEQVTALVSVHHAQLDFQGDGALRAFESEMESQDVAHWATKYYGHMEHGWTDPSLAVYSRVEAETAHQDMFGTYQLLFPAAQ